MTSITFEKFVDLPTRRKKEIIEKAVIFANREQLRIMKAYNKKFQKKQ